MRDTADIVAEARRWLATHRETQGPRYAPALIEALRNGPLDEDALMEALEESSATGDTAATRLVGHLLALDQDARDTVADLLQTGA